MRGLHGGGRLKKSPLGKAVIFLLWAQTNTFLSGLPDDFGANGVL